MQMPLLFLFIALFKSMKYYWNFKRMKDYSTFDLIISNVNFCF